MISGTIKLQASAANPWLGPTRRKPRQGRKTFIYSALFYRPFRALFLSNPYQGFAALACNLVFPEIIFMLQVVIIYNQAARRWRSTILSFDRDIVFHMPRLLGLHKVAPIVRVDKYKLRVSWL